MSNTIATYLIILEYINFTKFEIPLSIVAVNHALRALSLLGLVNKRVLRGRIREDNSPFFFLFSLFFFFIWVLVFCVLGGGVVCFWVLIFRGGGGGVVVLPGWLTIITLFYIAKVKPSSGFQTLMLTFTIK